MAVTTVTIDTCRGRGASRDRFVVWALPLGRWPRRLIGVLLLRGVLLGLARLPSHR